MREKLARIGIAIALVLGLGATAACDREDKADVREGVNDVEREAENIGEEAEEELDKLDSDGKDD